MLTTLGFHADRDYQAELDALQPRVTRLRWDIDHNRCHSPEERHNTYALLDSLLNEIDSLTCQAAAENQHIHRLTDAARATGDPQLAAIAYVVFGTQALPC